MLHLNMEYELYDTNFELETEIMPISYSHGRLILNLAPQQIV